ncbi:probable pyridoxine 4-dehydrogenase [Cephalotrichum gorgonifer]|uniref:Probable pyridoxine 4-dehydrogenase n=1 Tax=Cephalotrichum gorgonifer TaxID=2041049 RepID=A0AAE8N0M4_9PEZI|nr:probable pyridoxine 4-dehydrogenase [Cephalotrichum gorgonifer]
MPQVAGKEVGPIGFGLMGLTARPGVSYPEARSLAALRSAVSTGCTLWNGGEFYGTPTYNSMTLLRRYFIEYPEDADKVVICIKGGVDLSAGHPRPDGSAAQMSKSMKNILAQLGGTKKVDMFECARRDPNVPLQETFGALKEFIDAGKLGGISLSEVSAATIHEAAAITKVLAVEIELSLWSTDALRNGIVEACAKHDIPLMAYCPLGMGMLTGQIKSPSDIPPNDFRHRFPRFQPENFDINIELVRQVEALAAKKGCTPAQFALGWLVALSRRPDMPTIIPIPGSTTSERVEENAKAAELSDEEMAEIDATLAKFEVLGGRWPEGLPVNT